MKDDIVGGRYRLDHRLAEGGMGEVWLAHDQLLDRDVAMKLLKGSLSSEPNVVERFRREARAAASVAHRNMANVFDYVEEGAKQGIVMELVAGITLAQRIADRAPMEVEESVSIIAQVLDALGAAHDAGIIHRDMKPGNIMIAPGDDVKVADFGIARALGDSTLTETGSIMGSVHYLAPEQLTGATVPASDLYSVGAILYEMLTGHKPFEGGTSIEVAMKRLSIDPPPPSAWRGNIPASIEAVIVRALHRDPSQRYDSAPHMRQALLPPSEVSEQVAVTSATMRLPKADDATVVLRAAAAPPKGRRLRLRSPLVGLTVIAVMAAGLLFSATRPTTTAIPDFAGKTIGQARDLAKAEKLTVVEKGSAYSDTIPKGTVMGQSVKAGTIVERDSTVGLAVSKGPRPCCTVPDLTGKTPSQAAQVLEAARLKLGSTRCVDQENETGLVVSQSPVPTPSVAPGSSVSIVISGCPKKGRGKGDD